MNIQKIECIFVWDYNVNVRTDKQEQESGIHSLEVKTLLDKLTDLSLIQLGVEACDWQDAIRKSATPLLKAGKIKASYIEGIIESVLENGPYIVITTHVALPHARPEAGAIESAIGITTLAQPVVFGNKDNDPVKYLFTLSATDNTKHLNALADLAGLFERKDFFDLLDSAKDPQEVMDYLNK